MSLTPVASKNCIVSIKTENKTPATNTLIKVCFFEKTNGAKKPKGKKQATLPSEF